MSSNVVPIENTDKQVARPLKVLVLLIKQDLVDMNEAAETATKPYQIAIGEKLLEAKGQQKHGEFSAWIQRHFDISLTQARRYMSVVPTTFNIENNRPAATSLSTLLRDAGHEPRGHHGHGEYKPIHEIAKRAAETQTRLRNEELSRAEEREAQRRLALQLIDIGYKALASKFHPDRGGSREAMARLNEVRNRLKAHI
jgi:hypothetical protein